MRFISTLATLLLGLAVGLLALGAAPQNALACHKSTPHGAVISCDGGGPPDPDPDPALGPLVVRDGTGELVGPMFDFAGREVRANGSVRVAMQMEVAGVPRIFDIGVGELGFEPGGPNLFSEDLLCGEPLYKSLTGALSNFERAFYDDGKEFFDDAFAYISEADSEPVFITQRSTVTGEGLCQGATPALRGPYFPVVSVDLTAFVPPFSAGF